MQMRNAEQFSTKTGAVTPLPGSMHARWVRCGKATCHCAAGDLHGPYFRRVWREGGTTKSVYVPLAGVAAVRAACAAHARIHQSRRAFQRMVRTLEQRSNEVIGLLDALKERGGWDGRL